MLRVIFIPIDAISGLNVNCLKSNIYPINEVTDIHRLTENLSGRTVELSKVYLGIPLGASLKVYHIPLVLYVMINRKM